jgi:hypothetical protein
VKVISALVLLIVLACACSQQETQKTLARRLSEADRVTIAGKDQSAFVMPLTPQEAKSLTEAIANAKRERETIDASPELRIGFFKGTNVLGAFDAGAAGVFWIDHGPDPGGPPGLRRVATYSDSSGTLQTLGEKFRRERDAQLKPSE